MDDAFSAVWLALEAEESSRCHYEAAKERWEASRQGLVSAVKRLARQAGPAGRNEAVRACYWGLPTLNTKVIGEAFGIPATNLAIIAGPAEGHGIACSLCGEEVRVGSRTAREELLNGTRPRVCAACPKPPRYW